jgi:hypothetical protein
MKRYYVTWGIIDKEDETQSTKEALCESDAELLEMLLLNHHRIDWVNLVEVTTS